MMNTHPGGAEHGDGPDERHPERTGTIRIRVAQDQDARAHDGEREERADVRQVVGLGRVADERSEGNRNTGDERRDVRNARTGWTFAAHAGNRPSRAIAKKIRGWPYWKTRSTAVIETTAPSATIHPTVVARQAERARQRIGNRELLYGTMPVSTAPMIT